MKVLAIALISVLSVAASGLAQDTTEIGQSDKRQTKQNETQSPQLHELGWMVGTWVDQGEDAAVTTTCSWTHNNKFLTRSFRLTVDDVVGLEGTQMVGWDPIANEIRSWTFDSEGGFGEGQWIKDGNRWLVKTSFTLASGECASAINIITFVNQDTLRWQSTNREIAGELQPNIPEVTVVRQKSEDNTSNQNEQEDSP